MNFDVLVLGSGAATPTYNRHCSAQLLSLCGSQVLVDCGEGTQNQIRKYHKKIQSIRTIFISHLHGDHFFGLPGLLSTMHLCGRTEPLTVYAPKGAKAVIDLLFEVSGTEVRYELVINEIDVDDVTTIHCDKHFSVKAFPLNHSITTFGFLFEENNILLNLRPHARSQYNMTNDDCIRVKQGEDLTLDDGSVIPNSKLTLPPRLPRRYAYCCDTAYDESLIPIVEGVDMLCMESTFDNSLSSLAEERCHCTALQAATIAAKARVRRLVLTHFSARYTDIAPLLAEAQTMFADTCCATDGAVFQLVNQQAMPE